MCWPELPSRDHPLTRSVGAGTYAAVMSEAAALAAAAVAPAAPAPLRAVRDDRPSPAPLPTIERLLELPDYDLAAALALERELGVSHTLAQVMVRRGLDQPRLVREFLDPREAYEPAAFTGIERAVELIERHVRAGTEITVHGDYDVDGVCATATMVRALRSLGANAGWFLPGRLEDGYGVSLETIRRLAARGTGLLITVDCGITAIDEIAAARALGLDVVVSDHHAPRARGGFRTARLSTRPSVGTRVRTCVEPASRTSSRRRSARPPPRRRSSLSRSRRSPI